MKEFQEKYNIQIKKIWWENADENHAWEALCKKDRNGIAFEYTEPDTPQKWSC